MYTQNVVRHSLGLLLGTEAPVMTPNSIDFSFHFVFFCVRHKNQVTYQSQSSGSHQQISWLHDPCWLNQLLFHSLVFACACLQTLNCLSCVKQHQAIERVLTDRCKCA